MAVPPLIEIREPGFPVRRVRVDRTMEVGRDCDGVVITDLGASRRHLKLLPSPLGLSVVDLASRNGTLVNGVALNGRITLEPGDVIRLGRTEVIVVRPRTTRPLDPPPAAFVSDLTLPAPPAARPVVEQPGKVSQLVRAIFRGAPVPPDVPTFRNFLELPRRIPPAAWKAVRVVSVLSYLALCVAMFVAPVGAMFTFFQVIVPLLPILFFVAPGLWRNICPLAATNQTPRVLGFSRALTPPAWLRRGGYLIGMTLFFGIAGARLVLFNQSARATGVLLSVVIASAFVGGVVFKGKSGWCSSICPLLPLQRVYGQTPFVVVPNSHCTPCVACTKNCYDFKPQPAYQADLHDPDPHWSAPRKLFVAALPGFVLGFFTLVNVAGTAGLAVYGQLALYVAGSIASFYVLDAVLALTPALMTALYAAAALNTFYWFAGVVLAGSAQTITGLEVAWIRWPISGLVAMLTVVWISRTYWTERAYLAESVPATTPTPLTLLPGRPPSAPRQPAAEGASKLTEVRFLPQDSAVTAEVGASLLEIAEREGLSIEAGCRMGVCGADPVAVVAGMDCLSAPEDEELTTLRRLGLAPSTRMACCARVQTAGVQVNLTPEPGTGTAGERPENFDRSITSVVVLGNGIAGVTAADFVRRGHPDCEVHLVGMESHVLYNRMGISRLVHGRSAMTGLFLLDEQWYSDKSITMWLNTIATRIDPAARRVLLGTGDVLAYDRLILAMGSSGVAPRVVGFGADGSYVLRSAADALEIRRYSQLHGCRQAVVAGGGLLGLEAAYAMYELGLDVTVLERGRRLLAKQIDQRGSELVQGHFDRLGIRVLYRAESAALGLGDHGRVESLTLTDGRTLGCDVFLACVGISSNTDLADAAGITVKRGIVVDDRMQTSAPGIYAAGDVAEHDGRVLGLWPIAAKQGEVAALNALGGDERLSAEIPATILKGVGLELSSIGRVEPETGDELIVVEDARRSSYRRLILSNGVVVGALIIGHHPEDLAAATAAVKKQLQLDAAARAALRAGDWRSLKPTSRVPAGI